MSQWVILSLFKILSAASWKVIIFCSLLISHSWESISTTLRNKQCMDIGEMFASLFSKVRFLVWKEPVLLELEIWAVRRLPAALLSLLGWLLCIGIFELEDNAQPERQVILGQAELPLLARCLLSLQCRAWRKEKGSAQQQGIALHCSWGRICPTTWLDHGTPGTLAWLGGTESGF